MVPRPAPGRCPRADTARTELPLEPANSEVHVQALPADSTVVLLLGRSRPLSSKTAFTFQQYDQALHLRQERALEVPDEFDFTRMCAEGGTVYALFSSRSVPGRLWVAAYNGHLGQTRTQQFETKLSREIVELKALDGRLFATVLLNDQLHVTALLLDVATGQMQYLPSVYEPLPTQLTFVADAATRRAEYVLSQTNGRKSRLLLKQLTEKGQLVSSEFVQAESDRSLITAQVTPPQDTTARLLMGTYSLRDPTYAQGLFATDLRPAATRWQETAAAVLRFPAPQALFRLPQAQPPGPAAAAHRAAHCPRRAAPALALPPAAARVAAPGRWRLRAGGRGVLPALPLQQLRQLCRPHQQPGQPVRHVALRQLPRLRRLPDHARAGLWLRPYRHPALGQYFCGRRTCAAPSWKKPYACNPCPMAASCWLTSTRKSSATSSSTGPKPARTTCRFPSKPVPPTQRRARHRYFAGRPIALVRQPLRGGLATSACA